MHASFQELLNLRDGAPVEAGVHRHAAGCPQCTGELERLKRLKSELRSLPQHVPPRHVWHSIREELERAPRRGRGRPLLLAVAATVLIASILALLQFQLGDPLPRTVTRSPTSAPEPESLQRLVSRSQQLEDLLQRLPPRPSVERASTSAAIDDLQTRIQVLDLQLDTIPRTSDERRQTEQLWSRRVQLLHSLIDVRFAEAVRDGDEGFNSRFNGVI